ncbi:MAG TPA: DUF2269 family protein [Anaerolineales bacterium]|nr:DUF2269 family protein [Anaerolineales bacterium]
MLFSWIKWIHVLSAITAVGANITYGIWIAQASREPKALPFVLRNIKLIDQRLANPCYGLLLLTGLTMAFMTRLPLTTPWLLTALVLYVLAALLGIAAYAPLVRRQIQLLESEGFDSPNYQAVAKQGTRLGVLVTVDVIIIVLLMVVKPMLWG